MACVSVRSPQAIKVDQQPNWNIMKRQMEHLMKNYQNVSFHHTHIELDSSNHAKLSRESMSYEVK